MSCSNYCHQGRLPCPTPWTCGHADKANYEMPIQFVGREPEEESAPKQWPFWLIAAGAVVCLAAVLVLSADTGWPRLVYAMSFGSTK